MSFQKTITLPNHMKWPLKRTPRINWSAVARAAFEAALTGEVYDCGPVDKLVPALVIEMSKIQQKALQKKAKRMGMTISQFVMEILSGRLHVMPSEDNMVDKKLCPRCLAIGFSVEGCDHCA